MIQKFNTKVADGSGESSGGGGWLIALGLGLGLAWLLSQLGKKDPAPEVHQTEDAEAEEVKA